MPKKPELSEDDKMVVAGFAERLRKLFIGAKKPGYGGLARVLGCAVSTAQSYVVSDVPMPITGAARISRALGVSLDWLVFGGEPPPAPPPAPPPIDEWRVLELLAIFDEGERRGHAPLRVDDLAERFTTLYNTFSDEPAETFGAKARGLLPKLR